MNNIAPAHTLAIVGLKEIHALAKKAGLAQHGLGWTAWESQLERFARAVADAAIAADRAARAEAAVPDQGHVWGCRANAGGKCDRGCDQWKLVPVGWAYWHHADPDDSFVLTTLRWASVNHEWRESPVYTFPPAAPAQDHLPDAAK